MTTMMKSTIFLVCLRQSVEHAKEHVQKYQTLVGQIVNILP